VLVIMAASVVVQQTINSATEVLDELPQAVQKLRYAITSWEREGRGPLKQVSKTADELQKLAGATASVTTATQRQQTRPRPRLPPVRRHCSPPVRREWRCS
jgi:hypothetical protein